MRKRGLALVIMLAVAAAGSPAAPAAPNVRPPSQVVDLAAGPGPLAAKLEAALTQASKASSGRAFWIGYSIERLQGDMLGGEPCTRQSPKMSAVPAGPAAVTKLPACASRATVSLSTVQSA